MREIIYKNDSAEDCQSQTFDRETSSGTSAPKLETDFESDFIK